MKKNMKKKIFSLIYYSYNEVEQMLYDGRVSVETFIAYKRIWGWSAFRYSGEWGNKQAQFWNHWGKEKFYNKMNKTRKAFGFEELKID